MRIVTLAVAVSRTAVAQQTPRVVSGAVRDSVGRPLENAVIVLDPSEETRATRANAQGRFRFDNVKPGRHELRTTWVGYRPDDRVIEVPAAGFEVEIVLPLLPFKLDTLRIVAQRTGALGTTVVHSDFRALGGVDIEVMGSRAKARTGSDGRFAFPALREGAYLLEAKRADFKTRMISFPVPPNDAVELVVMMDSITTKVDRLAENTFRDMEMRWHRRSAPNSALVPRHELASQRGQPLNLALRYAPSFLQKGLVLSDLECVWVNGKPAPGMLMKDYSADDVAMVEVYGVGAGGAMISDAQAFQRMSGNRSCGAFAEQEGVETGRGTLHTIRRPRQGDVSFVYIWLK